MKIRATKFPTNYADVRKQEVKVNCQHDNLAHLLYRYREKTTMFFPGLRWYGPMANAQITIKYTQLDAISLHQSLKKK